MVQVGMEWLLPLAGFAASWGGARASLNGTRKRVEKMDDKLDVIIADNSETKERVARIEGTLAIEERRK